MPASIDFFSERSVDFASAELKEIVDQAGLGNCSWSNVAEYLHDLFPGFMSFAVNQSVTRPHLNFHAFPGLENKKIEDYFHYYGALNPWLPAWDRRQIGTISRSEVDDPIRLKSSTEFYNDWLNKGIEADAAVGIKIGANKDEVCYLGVHYSAERDAIFGPALERILGGVQGHFIRAVEMNHHIALTGEKAASTAALVDRSHDIGVVVDGSLQVLDANEQARHVLDRAGILHQRLGALMVKSRDAQDWLRRSVEIARRTGTIETRRLFFEWDSSKWRMSVTPLSGLPNAGMAGLFAQRRLFLVLLRNTAKPVEPADGSAFREHYKLTAREWALCQEILNGHDLAESGERLGIATETVRYQLKSIFRKTGTSRQSSLMALMTRAL